MDPHILDAVIVILVMWESFPIYIIQSRINQALSYAGVHSNVNYYDLNPNLDVGIAIDILGVGYVNAPFDYHANKPSGRYKVQVQPQLIL